MHATESRRDDRLGNRYREQDCAVQDFIAALRPRPEEDKVKFAVETLDNVPIYDCRELGSALKDREIRADLQDEWINVLNVGAGVLVLKHMYADTAPVDEATAVFESVIQEEREAGVAASDHFAKAGANDRIWNAQEKLCLHAPGVFARYFSCPSLCAIAEAWLGPHFQVTSQVNVVRPGGQAQQAHRDYHLGFQTVAEAERYPAHVHAMSPFLTLQGAIAHTDMPVESGPTKLLPYSQRYAQGYLAWRRQDFRDYFESHYVQLQLEKGDGLFFNPALFHAAGSNRTASVQRMANLLQISSAYGRAMESVNRLKMCEVLYPVLLDLVRTKRITQEEADAVIASSAEGYPFPTNLDKDPPQGGLAPESQQALFRRALAEHWNEDRFVVAIHAQAERRDVY
jgi:ectoine hydroxylase-related dioxygenase (phytanoyl-CoA dioxygenase family)